MKIKGKQPPTILDNVKVITHDNNDMYPLPADFATLTADGQRLARCNACAQRNTPVDFVASWSFFRGYYLEPTPPGFFYKRWVPSPPSHAEWIRDVAMYRRSIHAAPRGCSKSTVFGKELSLLLLLTRPYFEMLQILAVYRMMTRRLGDIMFQLENNERIIEDFGWMKPAAKGGRQWSIQGLVQLGNGANLEGATVDGRKRGSRPDFILLDDPEYDPKKPGQETVLRAQLDQLLFHELIPMFDADTQVFEWIGTLVGARSALYAAVRGDDPRFRFFNRRVYSAERTDSESGEKTYFWDEKMGETFLKQKRKLVGERAFQAEWQGNPISAASRVFNLHEEYNMYSIYGDEVRYTNPDGSKVTMSHADWIRGLGRLITVDLRNAITGVGTDFSGALCIGIDEHNAWWVLDLYLGRVASAVLMAEIWRMGNKWQAGLVGVESVMGQEHFRQWLESKVADEAATATWEPRAVYPIRYPPGISKEDRITLIGTRAANFQLRLPAHKISQFPFSELYRQIELFTSDGLSLDYDDAIDMLSMVRYCPRVRAGGKIENPEASKDIFAQLAAGNILDSNTGLPITSAIDICEIPLEILEKFLAARQDAEYNKRRDRSSSLTRRSRYDTRTAANDRIRFLR